MTRPLRIEYPGAIYHVLSRGDRREAIVVGDSDRELFFDLLGRACKRTAWQVHSATLMTNHFHLVIETPRANLSAGMQWLLGRYTHQFNQKHRLSGHQFDPPWLEAELVIGGQCRVGRNRRIERLD